jgi:hypothetical protein
MCWSRGHGALIGGVDLMHAAWARLLACAKTGGAVTLTAALAAGTVTLGADGVDRAALASEPARRPKVVFEAGTTPAPPVAGQAFLYRVRLTSVGGLAPGRVRLRQSIGKGVRILKLPRNCKQRPQAGHLPVAVCTWKNIRGAKPVNAELNLFPDARLPAGSPVAGRPTVTYLNGRKAKPAKHKPAQAPALARMSDLVLSRLGHGRSVKIEQGTVTRVTLDVLNRGPSTADGITVAGTLPDGVELAGAELTGTTPGNVQPRRKHKGRRHGEPVCRAEHGRLRCVIGTLQPGEHRWLRATVGAAPGAKPGRRPIEPSLSSSSQEPESHDNGALIPIRILAHRPLFSLTRAHPGSQTSEADQPAVSPEVSRDSPPDIPDPTPSPTPTPAAHEPAATPDNDSKAFGAAGRINAGGVISLDHPAPPPASAQAEPPAVSAQPTQPTQPTQLTQPTARPQPAKAPPPMKAVPQAASGTAGQTPLVILMAAFLAAAVAGVARGKRGEGEHSARRIPWPVIGYRVVCSMVILIGLIPALLFGPLIPGFSTIDYLSSFAALGGILTAAVLLTGTVREVPARLRGGTVLAMATLAVAFIALPAPDAPSPVGWPLHLIVPVVVFLDWLIAPPSGRLPARATRGWAVVALAYLAYTLLRGAFADWYPYPFLDPDGPGGYARVIAFCLGIGLVMAALARLIVWIGARRTVEE